MSDRASSSASPSALAVLVSGGLDSAILTAEAARSRPAVWPLYMRFGLYWEEVELLHLRRFLHSIASRALRPLTVLDMPVGDLYGAHWSMTGDGVPGAETPDDAVFLPGRNLFFLTKALVWCHLREVPEAALAPLEQNPFPDATPAFFRACQDVVNQAVGGRVRVSFPYLGLSKVEVLLRGEAFPLEYTFSCLRPAGERHCGACNKCRERRGAFAAAGVADPTVYERS